MALTMVVFPTPGPPVMTSTLDISASLIAATWLSARARPMCFSTHGKALSGSIQGHGNAPLASRVSRSIERGPDQLLRHLKELLGQRDQLFCWQTAMPLVHGLGQRIGNPRADPDRRSFLDTKLHRDGVGGLEPDTADISR